MEKNKNRRIFEFHGKSKDREIRGREHNCDIPARYTDRGPTGDQ